MYHGAVSRAQLRFCGLPRSYVQLQEGLLVPCAKSLRRNYHLIRGFRAVSLTNKPQFEAYFPLWPWPHPFISFIASSLPSRTESRG